MKRIGLLATSLGLVWSSVPVHGQVAQTRPQPLSGTYSVEGKITTRNFQAIATARVVLSSVETPTGQTTFSDDDGRFFFYDLRPGSYRLMVSASGFKTLNLDVDLGFGSRNLALVLEANDGSRSRPAGGTVHADLLNLPKSCLKHYEKGRKALQEGDEESAVKHLRAALKERQFAVGYSTLGIAYISLHKPKKAQQAFEACLALSEEWGEAHLGLGLLANDRGRYEEAETHLLRARGSLPDEWRVEYELGRSHYHRNQFAEAERALRQAHRHNPNFGSLHLLLANIFAMTDRLAEAAAEMREFLKTSPDSKLAPQVREKVKLLESELSKLEQ